MSEALNHESLLREDISVALTQVVDLCRMYRSGRINDPAIIEPDIYVRLVDMLSGSSTVWLDALNQNEVPLNIDAAGDFLRDTCEICDWLEVGFPSVPDSLLQFFDFCKNYMSSFPKIFVSAAEVADHISSALCGPYQYQAELDSDIKSMAKSSGPQGSAVTNSGRETMIAMRARLYAQKLRKAETQLLELNEKAETWESTIDKLRDSTTEQVAALASSRMEYESELKKLKQLRHQEGADKVSRHYKNYARRSSSGYWLFLGIGVVIFIIAGWEAVRFTSVITNPNSSAGGELWASVAWRIALVSGAVAIGGLLLKQASHFRAHATWARSIVVQLNTFDAYTADITDPTEKNILRAEFSRRVFGNEPNPEVGSSQPNDSASSLIPVLAEMLRNTQKGQ
ncbi:hypothetical protein [Glutamicibacter sp. X7]